MPWGIQESNSIASHRTDHGPAYTPQLLNRGKAAQTPG